jgi:hypothetical protein
MQVKHADKELAPEQYIEQKLGITDLQARCAGTQTACKPSVRNNL